MEDRFLKNYIEEISPPKTFIVLGWVSFALLSISTISSFIIFYFSVTNNKFYKSILISGGILVVSLVLIIIFGNKVNKYHKESFNSKIEKLQEMIKDTYFEDCDNIINKLNGEKILYNINTALKKVIELQYIYGTIFQEVKRKKKLVSEAISAIFSSIILAFVKLIIDEISQNIEATKMMELIILIFVFIAVYFLILLWVDDNLFFIRENNLLVLINSLEQYKVMLVGDVEIESNIVIPTVIKKVEINSDERSKETKKKNKFLEIKIYRR